MDLHRPSAELHPDGGAAVVVELIPGEAGQQVALAYTRLSYENHWRGEMGQDGQASSRTNLTLLTLRTRIPPSPLTSKLDLDAHISFNLKGIFFPHQMHDKVIGCCK